MRVRFFVFFLMFSAVFPLYAATTKKSGSSQLGKPSVKFKEWQIGRSDKNTDSNEHNPNPTSFITSTETECHFVASVVYDGNQGDNVSPIDLKTIKWTIMDQDPSQLALDTSSVKKNWSGSHPSKLAESTSFNVIGTISVPNFNKNTSCSHSDAQRLKRIPRHRGGKKLGFTLVFSAKTEDGQNIKPAKLVLKADDIDQVRQEYVDYNKPIPKRGDKRWQGQDTYDFGHYKIMLNYSLPYHHDKWVREINKLRGTDKKTGEKIPAFAVGDFVLTSGYRHPHHNYKHTPSTALLSPHMYGYALDVRGTENAAKKPLDIDGDKKNTEADREDMAEAAKPNAGARYTNIYSSKHVHVDWAPDSPVKWEHRKNTSKPAKSFSLPPQSTDSPLQSGNNNNNGNNGNAGNPGNSQPTPQTRPCGHSLTASGDHALQASCSTDANCISTNFYSCQHTNHTYGQQACGHTYDPGSSSAYNHRSVDFACSKHAYYACQTPSTSETNRHTYQTMPCGNHNYYACRMSWIHKDAQTCPTDSNGNSCSSGSYYSCSSHTHSYPSTNNNNNNNGNSGDTVTCASGHTYASNHPNVSYLNNLHRTRTCRRSNCGQSWQACVNGWSAPDCLSWPGHSCWAQ